MRSHPVAELQRCSVRGCLGRTDKIIQRTIGEEKLLYGYCAFHSVISESFFRVSETRVVLHSYITGE